jgi:hypothetical protein
LQLCNDLRQARIGCNRAAGCIAAIAASAGSCSSIASAGGTSRCPARSTCTTFTSSSTCDAARRSFGSGSAFNSSTCSFALGSAFDSTTCSFARTFTGSCT